MELVDTHRCKGFLEETDGLAHGRLDVERLDVLPVLLEEGDEEVDAYRETGQITGVDGHRGLLIRTQHDVGKNLVFAHLDVADSNTQAENLLQLELDSRLNFDDLVAEVFSMGDRGGELAS